MTNAQDNSRIPISISLDQLTDQPTAATGVTESKSRLIFISALAVIVGSCISILAKFLVLLINLITNVSFHFNISADHATPLNHVLGVFVNAVGSRSDASFFAFDLVVCLKTRENALRQLKTRVRADQLFRIFAGGACR